MIALAIVLIILLLFVVVVYGRALAYAFSEEYKLDQRIKQFTKR